MSTLLPNPATAHALDTLQAMMNLVFMQTGRIFSDPSSRNSIRSKGSLKKPIPFALERFHDSLDELETELLRAKMILRRDLALFRAEREKEEKANAAERQRVAAEASSPKRIASSVVETSSTSKATINDHDDDADVVMENIFDVLATENDSARDDEQKKAPENKQSSIALEISTDLKESSKDESKQPPTGDQSVDDLFEKTPTTADVRELNFESFFDDLPIESPSNNFDENVGLSEGFSLSLPEDPNGANSLLSGIESYADNDTDFVNLNSEGKNYQNAAVISEPKQDLQSSTAETNAGDNFGDLVYFGEGDNSQDGNEFADAMAAMWDL